MVETYKPTITTGDRQQLASAFHVGRLDVSTDPTLTELKEVVDEATDPSFASMGDAIREDLTEQLEVDLVESTSTDLEAELQNAESIREAGIPGRDGVGDAGIEALYRSLIDPVWTVYHHLVDVGFFTSLEENLPAFTPDHIDHTARGLLATDVLTDDLADCGFDEYERTALLLDVVDNNTRLSHWVPTRDIPAGVEFNVDYVPPLYHRAIGGGLLWVKALDRHLRQKKILLTESILDDAFWRTKAILGGVYVFLRGVESLLSTRRQLTDEQMVAALSGGAAITIVNQEEMMQEAFWIHEEKRASPTGR